MWETRRSSGFPWPFHQGMRGDARWLLLGYPRWSPVPLRRQVAGVPLRPWRYARMVRNIARTRAVHYTHAYYDDVP